MDTSYIVDENKYKICYIVYEQDLINENKKENSENSENPENPENPENLSIPVTVNTQTNNTSQNDSKADIPPNDIAIELEEEHDLKYLYKFSPKKYEVCNLYNKKK